MKLPENEWLTLEEVAWVNDPDREEAKVIEELLVKHVFGDSDKPLTPTCKIEAPGVRVRLYKTEKGGDYGWGAKDIPVVSGLVLRKREGEWTGHSRPPYKAVPLSEKLGRAKRCFSFQFSGYLEFPICDDARNSGKTTGMIELNPVRPTPMEAILKGKRHPFISLHHTLPDGRACRVEPLGSLEVSERDLLIHLDNMRRFVKGNQTQEKRLEQLISGSSGPEQVTGHNIESSPTIKLPVIAGKEVIPVRLIPLITTPEITPLQLVECLWNPRGDFLKRLNHYPFYGDWKRFYEEMKAVANGGIGKQLEQFQSGMYVVRADFEEHAYVVSKAVLLELDTAIPAPLLALAFEGFEASPVTSFINPAPAACPLSSAAKTLESLIVPPTPAAEEVEAGEQKKSAEEELALFVHSELKVPDTEEVIKHYSQEAERLFDLGYTEQEIAKVLHGCEYVDAPMIGKILCPGGNNPDDNTFASRAYRLIGQGKVIGKRRKKNT